MSCKIRFWDRVQYKARRTHLLLRNGQESKSVWLELPTLSLTNDFLFFDADSTDGITIRDSSRNSSSEDSLLLTSSSSLGTSPVIKRKSHSESTFKVKFHHSLPLFCCIHLFACTCLHSPPQTGLTATLAKCIHDVTCHEVFAAEPDYYACYAAVVLA